MLSHVVYGLYLYATDGYTSTESVILVDRTLLYPGVGWTCLLAATIIFTRSALIGSGRVAVTIL